MKYFKYNFCSLSLNSAFLTLCCISGAGCRVSWLCSPEQKLEVEFFQQSTRHTWECFVVLCRNVCCVYLCKGSLERWGHGAVDEEVWGEVQHDKKMSYRLQTHDPQRWDVDSKLLNTWYLNFWKIKNMILTIFFWFKLHSPVTIKATISGQGVSNDCPFAQDSIVKQYYLVFIYPTRAQSGLFTDLSIYLYGGTSADLSKIPPFLEGIVFDFRR